VVAPTPTPSPSLSPTATPTESLRYSATTHVDPASGRDYPATVVDIHVTGAVFGGPVGRPVLYVDPNETMGYASGADTGCTTDAGIHPIDKTFTIAYAFRQATSYPVHFEFWSGTCGSGAGPRHDWQTTLDITAASSRSNGPAQPYFHAAFAQATVSNGHIQITPSLIDDDGNIATMTVDWGNGDAPTTTSIAGTCDEPAPAGKYWPVSSTTQTATSPPLSPGTYTVTVTTTSTGCDGNDPQTASTSHTFTVPATR